MGTVKVRMTRKCRVLGEPVKAGDLIEVPEDVARELCDVLWDARSNGRFAVRVEDPAPEAVERKVTRRKATSRAAGARETATSVVDGREQQESD